MFQTTSEDVIFSGHGGTLPNKGHVTRVPYDVEFILFGPPGTSLSDELGQKLEGGIYISTLFIISPNTHERTPITPTIYTSKSGAIPNLILSDPRKLQVGGQGVVPHIVGVEGEAHLHDLWERLRPFIKKGKTLRVIWGACSTMGNDDPLAHGE